MILRNAVLDDAAAMADVDRASWPAELAADESTFQSRIDAFPEGQRVADVDGRIVGVSTAQQVTESFLAENGHSYAAITDNDRFTNSHDSKGGIYQLIGVSVLPEFRGDQLGRRLVDRQIEFARSLPNIQRIVGFTRPAHYFRNFDLTIDEYLAKRDDGGSLIDPIVAFHVNAGATVMSVHPVFRPEDREARGFGVLIEYPRH